VPLLSSPEQFEYICFAMTNMHAPFRLAQKPSRLFQIVQPSNAFFLLYRDASWINMPLDLIGSLKSIARPELDRSYPQRRSFGRNR
jgi:hypothetical protein